MEELYTHTTVTWTTQNDVYGCLFTAANGNTLFMPASGYRGGSTLFFDGSSSYTWTSTLNTDNAKCSWLLITSEDECNLNNDYRFTGRAVRPVHAAIK